MINIVPDTRPSSELSNAEMVAYLFQALRAQGMKTAKQVHAECERLFPDIDPGRRQECMVQLAKCLGGQSAGQVFRRPRQ